MGKHYSKLDIDKVKDAMDIRDFIPDIELIGNKYYAKCPKCGREHKNGMLVTHNKRMSVAKCFGCGYSISGAINAVKEYQGLDYVEAIEKIALQYGIPLESDNQKLKNRISEKKKILKDSFCIAQLKGSGLTLEDVTAKVRSRDGESYEYVQTFQKGALEADGSVNTDRDEMLILYYDLYGSQIRYSEKGTKGKLRPYIRTRWSNPDIHKGKDGKPIKYQSPKGAGIRFYFTQKIRELFEAGTKIDTLIIQEGEKKAEKACKHGILSIGIQGIYNIGSKDEGLIQDLQYLVKKCSIKNIILLFDSDWNDLSHNIENGDNIDQRPNQFAKAAIKFRNYVETLHNVGCFVDVWFGHINDNDNHEKGIDDLLCGTLKGKESEFLDDMKRTMKKHDGVGEYANFHKISTMTDLQIMDYWNLRDRDIFFEKHSERLNTLDFFKFGKVIYKRNEDGTLVKSTSIGTSAEFWSIETTEKGKREVKFDILVALSMLAANGFAAYNSPELGSQEGYLMIEKGVATAVTDSTMRRFLYDYVMQNCKDRDVQLFMTDKLSSILDKGRLERLRLVKIESIYEPEVQNRYYLNGHLRITQQGMEFGPVMTPVWSENVIKRTFVREPIFKSIEKLPDGSFDIKLTKAGEECEFYKFLTYTSFFWKDKEEGMQMKDWQDYSIHIVNKLTAIGFLISDFKYQSENKAVIGMDAQMSEVGQSNGRSGKSLIGKAISKICEQVEINGRDKTSEDQYALSAVTTKTRNIFFDDVRPNFDFGQLYQSITGDLNVNPKQAARFVIPYEKAPKIYIATNHAMNDTSDSAQDRRVAMSFSNWFNKTHKPIEEFGHRFFDEWTERQWQLFDNLMAECVMYYFKSMSLGWSQPGCGIVEPPMQDIRARELRQKMGEVFLQWAESYFDASSIALNSRVNKNAMWNNFIQNYPGQMKFVTSANFRKKLLSYCEYAGLHFNPHKPDKSGMSFEAWKRSGKPGIFEGDRESSGGEVYWTIATDEFASMMYIKNDTSSI